jgi:hypothetical protein
VFNAVYLCSFTQKSLNLINHLKYSGGLFQRSTNLHAAQLTAQLPTAQVRPLSIADKGGHQNNNNTSSSPSVSNRSGQWVRHDECGGQNGRARNARDYGSAAGSLERINVSGKTNGWLYVCQIDNFVYLANYYDSPSINELPRRSTRHRKGDNNSDDWKAKVSLLSKHEQQPIIALDNHGMCL